MSLISKLNHRCLIAHPSPLASPDATGQLFTDETGQPIGDATSDPTTDEALWADAVEVICRVEEKSAKWPQGPGAGPELVNSEMFFEPGTAIRELDKVRRIDVEPSQTYQVVWVDRKYTRGEHHVEAQVRRIPL